MRSQEGLATDVKNTHRSVIGSGRSEKKVSTWIDGEKRLGTIELVETEPWDDNE